MGSCALFHLTTLTSTTDGSMRFQNTEKIKLCFPQVIEVGGFISLLN